MKFKTVMRKAAASVLALAMLICMLPIQAEAYMTQEGGINVLSTSDYTLTDEVSMTRYLLRNSRGEQSVGYLTDIDLTGELKLVATYSGYYTAGSTAETRKANAETLSAGNAWGMSKTTKLAADYEATADAEGTILWATNGDYFNMQNGSPLGYLIMEGNLIKTGGEPFFAILKDGTAVIRDAGSDTSDVLEAVSGPFYLVQNGQVVYPVDTDLMPRNSVGVRADGTVVFFECDGRQKPYSAGITVYETACMMKEAGCVTAIYLDGGGSATVAARTNGKVQVYNSPSDGVERTISSGFLLVNTGEEASAEAGHEHSLLYNRVTDQLACESCDYSCDASDSYYSGFAHDSETERLMYFTGGNVLTGHVCISEEHYYFDDNGLAYTGQYTMCGETVFFRNGQYLEGSNARVLLAGRAGETADFIVTTGGVLYVDGTGSTYSHGTAGTVQWYNVRSKINFIYVGAGISGLGAHTFTSLWNMTTVCFAEGSQLKNCPNYCFAYNPKLETLILPEGVKTLGFSAFASCSSLKYLYLPDGMYYFGDRVFTGCSNLTLSVENNSKAMNYAKAQGVNYLVRKSGETHSWSGWSSGNCPDCTSMKWRTCTTCGEAQQVFGLKTAFTDIAEGQYFFNPVCWGTANRIVYGVSDTAFAPNKTCTRGEIVAFLYRQKGLPEPTAAKTAFADVRADAYYYKAVLWASENGIVYGTSDTTFAPAKTCTRAEAVAFLYRAAGCPEPESTETAFTDIDPNAYYYKAVLWASENGIVYGTSDTTFAPTKTCTRAEIVTFLYRAEGTPAV